MNEPTNEQKKEFWERYGARCINCRRLISKTIKPDMCYCHTYELPIDLNNLFKYAKDVVIEKLGKSAWEGVLLAWFKRMMIGEDPTLALFWVLWEVLK